MPESVLCAAARAASTVEVDGWTVAAAYGEPAAEYRALRDEAALVDLAFHARVRVTGSDRVDFLHGMLTNDVKGLAPGAGRATLVLTEQGKLVADAFVLALDDALLLDGATSAMAAAVVALTRFIVADDVELILPGDADHAFALYGPHAARVLGRLGVAAPPADDYDHQVAAVRDVEARVVRVPNPAAGGYLLFVPGEAVSAWWARCMEIGVPAAGHLALEALRIESGVPSYGQDIGPETLALEAPLAAAISFDKGCYLGQEVVERVSARGHVNRKLVGLEVDGAAVPVAGDVLLAGEREVGWVTSAVWSWRLGRPVALGYVRREHLAPGTTLTLRERGNERAVTVRSLPLV